MERRVSSVSGGKLQVVWTADRGRCLRAVVDVAAGDVLAEESPLVLGSSDGYYLSKTCTEACDVDASEDLLAACVALQSSSDSAEIKEVASELSVLDGEKSCDAEATESLHASMREHLQELVSVEDIARWRARCAANAETWIELVEGAPQNPSHDASRHEVRLRYGMFGALAMVEHSCRPNARTHWNAARGTQSLIASRRIAQGEHISRSYLDACALLQADVKRKERLKGDWGFDCMCARCRQQPADNQLVSVRALEAAEQLESGGVLDLQRLVQPDGLSLDSCATAALREAEKASLDLGLPLVAPLPLMLALLEGVQSNIPRTVVLHLSMPAEAAEDDDAPADHELPAKRAKHDC
eukprot:TRINITY_DN41460_c0_g1_i1.p1 TRINITY_DN41460_c0_g1~~TRINITY_DN41460_c0_g1_i1.p1  ORF type:complete len:388 (+),score=56.09 TRINITY_DN41460_c0_g1_i1:99-1166(+)